jgi:hypothetical protein
MGAGILMQRGAGKAKLLIMNVASGWLLLDWISNGSPLSEKQWQP